MILPNFFIIGAPKGGTTTLYHWLKQHPDIFMSSVKEPGFFWAFENKINFIGPGSHLLRSQLINSKEEYLRLFEKVTAQHAIGEASTRYISSPAAAHRIYDWIPHAKIIASLRHPADRAFSSYMRRRRDGIEPKENFADALREARSGRRDNWTIRNYYQEALYYTNLKVYFDLFPKSQISIQLFEDLKESPQTTLNNLFQFLGVEDSFQPDISEKYNESGLISNPLLKLIWFGLGPLGAFLPKGFGKSQRLFIYRFFTKNLEKESIPPDLRKELTNYFRDEILKLQDLINRDLNHWL